MKNKNTLTDADIKKAVKYLKENVMDPYSCYAFCYKCTEIVVFKKKWGRCRCVDCHTTFNQNQRLYHEENERLFGDIKTAPHKEETVSH
jgi:hypothetical protein